MRLKRFLCALLACALLIVPAVRPARATGAGATVGIIGGAIGTGGAAGGIAAGSVVLPVLGVVGAALAAYGINVALTDASQEAGLTKTQFIFSKLRDFADYAGLDVNAMVQGISQNVKVSPTGNIILDAAGGAIMSQFIGWLFDTDEVSSSPGFANEYLCAGSASWSIQNGGERRDFTFSIPSGAAGFFYRSGSETIFACVSFESGHSFSYSGYSSGTIPISRVTIASNSLNGYTYYAANSTPNGVCRWTTRYINTISAPVAPSYNDVIRNISPSDLVPSYSDDTFTGTNELWDENKDLLKPGTDDTISINPDLLNPVIENASAGDYTATVPDYLTALAHALDRTEADTVELPVTNTATGAAVPLAVPSTAAAAPAITNVAATSPDVVGAGALADPAIPISPANAVPGLQFDLTEIFPFCIPFDLVDMITLLSADPVTPRFHLAWTFPIVNAPVEFDVDLSQFDGIAAIVRPFELLIFVIGLALVTRDLIRG